MKRIFTLLVFTLLGQCVLAQITYTWTGASLLSNNASDGANWGTILAPVVPASTDNVVFNGTSTKNCTWDLNTINSFSVLNGYTGVISLGTADRFISGNLVINAGTFNSTSGILEMDLSSGVNTFSLGGGTFNHNSGSVDLYVNAGTNFVFSGNIILKEINFYPQTGNTGSRIIDFGTNLVTDDIIFNATGGRIYGFQGNVHIKNSLDLGNSSHTTTLSTNTANFIFDGTSASIIGSSSAGAGKAYLPNIQVNTSGTFNITNTINLLGNWTGTKGTLNAGSSTVNMYGSSAVISGTAVAFDNLVVQSGASVTFPANAQVSIGKNFTNTGSSTFPVTNVLNFNGGTTAQTISGSGFTAGSIRAQSGSRTITLGAPVTISDSLKVESNVTFAAGTNLTLSAGSALKARVAQLGTSASVTGNVKVETFIPGGTTGWANMGVNGVTGQTVANWDTYASSGGANGIPMTCTGCFYDQTATGSWFNSIAAWNEPIQYYDTLVTASTSLSTGKGFWVYVGDGQVSTNNLTLVNTGPLVQNAVSIGLTSTSGTNSAKGMNLVANPYASPVSWTKVLAASGGTSTGLTDAIYVWNADLSATTSFVNGVSSHGSSGITDVIPAGQGFYVETTSATNLVFSESVKVSYNTSANPLLRPYANNYGQVFHLKLKGSYDQDQMAFRIHPYATAGFDVNFDAHKIFQSPGYQGYPGPYTKYTSISSKDPFNEDYSVHSIPALTQSVTIPLLVKVSTSGTYTIEAIETENVNDCVLLKDKLLNATQDLKGANYIFKIRDTTSVPRFELILCRDQQENVTGINTLTNSDFITISQDAEGAYVTTDFPEHTKATIAAYNIMGKKLMEDVQVQGTINTTRLNLDMKQQVVLIRVVTDKETVIKKMVMH